MEALKAGLRGPNAVGSRGTLGGAYWDERAKKFAQGPMARAEGDPMLARLRKAVGRSGDATVLDVGAGPGRFTIAIAPSAKRVIAVDPSAKMLQILRRRAKEAGLRNIRTVTGTWQEAAEGVAPADVVLCSHVLPLVADVVPFIRALDAHARRRVLLYIGAFAADAVHDPFWRHFHGTSRKPGATYVDAVAVLEEMGIRPAVEVVELATRSAYDTLDDAVDTYVDQWVLPDTKEVRADVARLVEPWLQRRKGKLVPPFRTQPAAIVSWASS